MSSRTPRKSCDFCYRRKIKCDEQKPRCSPCAAHRIECTYTAPSRKVKPGKRHAHAELEARFDRLEGSFRELTELLSAAGNENEARQERVSRETSLLAALSRTEQEDVPRPDLTTADLPKPQGQPSLQHIMPVVDIFLQDYNSALPLFHDETLRHMVRGFYQHGPERRSSVVWAAIHVVLALAHRTVLGARGNGDYAADCLAKAQSVLPAVILGETQLLNVQVLVGMVILLQGLQEMKPAFVLIGTAVRLAHSIGLHNRTSSRNLDPDVASQRACVFWMAYILDKDTSMRSNSPSVQVDGDVDLHLPAPLVTGVQPDSTNRGLVASADGGAYMNFFLSRIQLAVIQGGIYDYLHSTSAKQRTLEQRSKAVDSIKVALEQWKSSIPLEFSDTAAIQRLPPVLLHLVRTLHATSLLCAALIAQAGSCNHKWVDALRTHARSGTTPSLTPSWQGLLEEGRNLLTMFESATVTDSWSFWTTGGPHVTAIMILATNGLCKWHKGYDLEDMQLVDSALLTLDNIIEASDSDKLRSYRDACLELSDGAKRRGLAQPPRYM